MANVVFTPNLARHLACESQRVEATTVRQALELVFAGRASLRGYLLDDQGGVRQHVAIFVDGAQVRDRRGLADPVTSESEIYVMQALSGG